MRQFRYGPFPWRKVCCTLGLLSGWLHSQVTIQNRPPGLEIPEQRLQLLHETVCHVVGEQFHVRVGKVLGPITVVLGAEQERTVADGYTGVYTIYLEQWDETAFVLSDTRLAIQRVAFEDSWDRLIREVAQRVRQIYPVGAGTLRSARQFKKGVDP